MRALIRALLFIVLLVVIAFIAFGWWTGTSIRRAANRPADTPTATTGTTETARQRGADP